MKNTIGKTSDFHKAKVAQLKYWEIGQNESIKYSISLRFQIYSLFITRIIPIYYLNKFEKSTLVIKGSLGSIVFLLLLFPLLINLGWIFKKLLLMLILPSKTYIF